MREKIKKQMNKVFDETWKKSLIIFLIVFLLIFIGGLLSINYLNDVIINNNIHSEQVTVLDKMSFSDYYIIIGTNNKTYSIDNNHHGHKADLFNQIQVGQTYRFTVKEPELTEISQKTHILQVHNVTD